MSSLSDIVQQLKENRQADETENLDLINTVNTMSSDIVTAVSGTNKAISSALLKQERAKLSEKEAEKEAKSKSSSKSDGGKRGSNSDRQGIFGRLFAGAGLGTLAGRLLAPLMAPLTGIISFLRVGGPVALVIGALYSVFHDIAENQTFKDALETLRSTWNDRIVPTFERIREAVSGLFQSEEFITTIENLRAAWDRDRDTIQDFIINTVTVTFDSIAGIVEGIAQMLEGDFLGGFTRISNSILKGITGLADNVITSVLRLFGADFGENGSFRTWLDEKIFDFVDNIKELWNTFFNGLKDRWNESMEFLSNIGNNISEFFDELKQRWNNSMSILSETISSIGEGLGAIKDLIVATVSYYGTQIKNDLMVAFEAMKATVLNIPDQIRLAIMENLRFGMPTIELPMPQWTRALGAPENFTLLSGFEVGVGNQQQIEEVRGRINERNTGAVDAIAGYRSETAAALEELNAARENFRSVMSQPLVVNNVDNSSRNSSNATVRYDPSTSAYNSDYFLRRNLAPDMLGR